MARTDAQTKGMVRRVLRQEQDTAPGVEVLAGTLKHHTAKDLVAVAVQVPERASFTLTP